VKTFYENTPYSWKYFILGRFSPLPPPQLFCSPTAMEIIENRSIMQLDLLFVGLTLINLFSNQTTFITYILTLDGR